MVGHKICSHVNCNKKLKPLDILLVNCKCDKSFCNIHKFPEYHNCEYLSKYKDVAIQKIKNNNILVVNKKIELI